MRMFLVYMSKIVVYVWVFDENPSKGVDAWSARSRKQELEECCMNLYGFHPSKLPYINTRRYIINIPVLAPIYSCVIIPLTINLLYICMSNCFVQK